MVYEPVFDNRGKINGPFTPAHALGKPLLVTVFIEDVRFFYADAVMRQQFFKTGVQRYVIRFPVHSKRLLGVGSDFFESIYKECQVGSFHQCLIDLVELEI